MEILGILVYKALAASSTVFYLFISLLIFFGDYASSTASLDDCTLSSLDQPTVWLGLGPTYLFLLLFLAVAGVPFEPYGKSPFVFIYNKPWKFLFCNESLWYGLLVL